MMPKQYAEFYQSDPPQSSAAALDWHRGSGDLEVDCDCAELDTADRPKIQAIVIRRLASRFGLTFEVAAIVAECAGLAVIS